MVYSSTIVKRNTARREVTIVSIDLEPISSTIMEKSWKSLIELYKSNELMTTPLP
jgi:hypothetical protein